MSDKAVSGWAQAAPYAIGLSFAPITALSATQGGWWLFLLPLWGLGAMTLLDGLLTLDEANADPQTDDSTLLPYKLITWIWFPMSFALIFGCISYVQTAPHLNLAERIGLFIGVGISTGGIGIVFAHELMHQKNRFERWLGDLLMGLALYGHFRSEHLLVHHPWVGTPRDPVTARYNEHFWRFFPRILVGCAKSAFRAERKMLERRNLPAWHPSNPFWRYAALQLAFLVLAYVIGGWSGVGLFILQAWIAISYLEMVNYVEHYGLTRKHLGGGKYEPVRPHHSWNSSHRVTNWLLINLQRHSDHHYKPDRRFPLLQTYSAAHAPQLPFGYPIMTAMALVPPLWLRFMNPRVRKWRSMYYPEITDWAPYKAMSNPQPRSAL